jgi:hypothetical protein
MAAHLPPQGHRVHRKRRESVLDRTDLFIQKDLQGTLEQLRLVWDKCGMVEVARVDRVSSVFAHLKGLLHQMLKEENEMLANLQSRVDTHRLEIDTLHANLALPEFETQAGLSLLEENERLNVAVESAEKELKERTTQLHRLVSNDKVLSHRLDSAPYVIDEFGVTPTREQLTRFEHWAAEANQLLEQRMGEYSAARTELFNIQRRLHVPRDELLAFERTVLQQDEAQFVLSAANMRQVNTMLIKARDQYNTYLEELRAKMQQVRAELELCWDRCCVPQTTRQQMPLHDAGHENTEQQYDAMQQQITHYNQLYDQQQQVFSVLNEWLVLWNERLEIEAHDNDPNKYKNRAGNLAKMLQRGTAIDKKLMPLARRAVLEAANVWD